MPGILKVGMTERTPDIRLREANASDTWRPPTPYTIEFAKKVYNATKKEKTLHSLLEQYTDRIHPRREFFRVSQEEVLSFFDLMDGEMWAEIRVEEEEEEEEEESEELEEEVKNTSSKPKPTYCRDMAKCFVNGQRIRHKIGINKIWICTYDSSKNVVLYDGKTSSLHQFVRNHYILERPDRTSNANAWNECEVEVGEKWISTYNLPE
jgi:hypothetical protein